MALLSVAPMTAKPKDVNGDVIEDTDDLMDDEKDVEEACKFCAETIAAHFQKILDDYYKVDFERWVACLVSDSCAVNIKLARLLNVAMKNCVNHSLASEIRRMLRNDHQLNDVLERIHELLKGIKGSLCNAAALRNFTDVRPIIRNATR